MEDTLYLCKERFTAYDIEIRTQIQSDAQIECRPTQISQVITNLLGNAYDAIEKLPEKWVSLDLRTYSKGAEIRITDSGNGIHPDTLKKVMHPFFTTKEVGKGTGLGLSISFGIIEEHQGSLTV